MAHFTLQNKAGLRLEGITLGATLTSLTLPVQGQRREVLLGCPLDAYPSQEVWMGAIAGRFANRIGQARLEHDGQSWALDANQAPNCLHGGRHGFHRREWSIADQHEDRILLTLLSEEGDQGFPGTLEVELEYRLEQLDLVIECRAVTSRPTPVSITSHAYFNLDGQGDVRQHRVALRADRYLPTSSESLPLSASVVEGVFDLRNERVLQEGWGSHPQQVQAKGYDHAFLNAAAPGEWLARVTSADSQLVMEMYTNQPSVQLYTGNWLAGTPRREGGTYADYAGLCLEAQQVPDSPNRPELGNPWLAPGERYHHQTRYRFMPA